MARRMARSHYVARTAAGNIASIQLRLKRLDEPDAGEQSLQLKPQGATPASTSTGGALNVDGTGATGAGAVFYTNRGADAVGRLVVMRVDNSAFPTQGLYIENDGVSHGALITHRSTGSNANGLAINSDNPNDTALGVRGRESGRGTIKVTHEKPDGVADGNASAVSINLSRANAADSASASQGIFIDSDHTTTGRLIQARQNGSQVWALGSSGWVDHVEQADPPAPVANTARLFARDNGAGKTQLCVRFPTGAVQVLSTEP